MPESSVDVLAGLGLVAGDWAGVVDLADGVKLTARAPTALDWSRARARIADVFDPLDRLRAASARYGMTADDRGALADPATWEGISEYCLMVEIADLVVSAINRTDAVGRTFALAPSSTALAALLRRGDNLDRFTIKMREAERELLVPKKEPAPSPDGFGAAAGTIAPDAEPTVTPAPVAD